MKFWHLNTAGTAKTLFRHSFHLRPDLSQKFEPEDFGKAYPADFYSTCCIKQHFPVTPLFYSNIFIYPCLLHISLLQNAAHASDHLCESSPFPNFFYIK